MTSFLAWLSVLFYSLRCALHLHPWKTRAISYGRAISLRPKFQRIITRTRLQRCEACGKLRNLNDSAPISHDWSFPARRFPAEDSPVRHPVRVLR